LNRQEFRELRSIVVVKVHFKITDLLSIPSDREGDGFACDLTRRRETTDVVVINHLHFDRCDSKIALSELVKVDEVCASHLYSGASLLYPMVGMGIGDVRIFVVHKRS
jgi:hypothetical protein